MENFNEASTRATAAEKERIALCVSPHKTDNGYQIGKHPDDLTESDFNAIGHEKRPLIKIIRAKCLDCCGGEALEVDKCVSFDCVSWPYRKGRNPQAFKREVSDEQREAAAERFASYRKTAADTEGDEE